MLKALSASLAALALVTTSVVPPSTLATTAPAEDPAFTIVGEGEIPKIEDEHVLTDLQAHAELSDTEEEALVDHQTGIDPFKDLADQASSSPAYVHAEWRPKDSDAHALLVFNDEVPESIIEATKATGLVVEFRITDAPSASAQPDLIALVYNEIYGHPEIDEVSVSMEPVHGVIEVEAATGLEPEAVSSIAAQALESGAARTSNNSLPGQKVPEVAVNVQDNLHQEPEYIGGENFGSGCTAGFVVSNGSAYGISTARHCTQAVTSYDGGTFTHHTRMDTSQGDARWLRSTSGVPSPQFQIRAGHPRFVSGWRTPIVGESVCKYGRTSGRTCAFVYRNSICSIGYCGLTAADKYISAGGDSGGPWYNGASARGVHHGVAPISGISRSLFSPVSSFSKMGAYVHF